MSTTPPALYVTTITEASIAAGCLEFRRRAQEAAATIDGQDFDDVVIEEHMTLEQLYQVPGDWLRGVRFALRADGTLVITNVETEEYKEVCSNLSLQIYKHANIRSGFYTRCQAHSPHLLTLGDGSVITPDLYVQAWERHECVMLFQVEVEHRSIQSVIRMASYYLSQVTTATRVVALKFLPPQQPDLDENGLLRVPALAIIFCRSAKRKSWIQVEQMRSFGNASIPAGVLAAFVEPEADSPLEPFPDALKHAAPSPDVPEQLRAENPRADLTELRMGENHEVFNVEMPAPEPAIPLDLASVFAEAMMGWYYDRHPRVWG
jgi:hypothetical protein